MEPSHVDYQDPIEQIQKAYENTLKNKKARQNSTTEKITQRVLYPENGIKDLADELLSVDKEIITIIIVNNKENTLISKTQKDGVNPISPTEEEDLAMDLQKIKQIIEKFDTPLGKIIRLHFMRDLVHQLVWIIQDLIIYATIKSTLEDYQVEEIAKKIESLFSSTTIVFQSNSSYFRRS